MKDSYPKRLIWDEGKVGGGGLLLGPLAGQAGVAQELAIREAGGEFEGYVVRRLLLVLVLLPAAGQAHVKAEASKGEAMESAHWLPDVSV